MNTINQGDTINNIIDEINQTFVELSASFDFITTNSGNFKEFSTLLSAVSTTNTFVKANSASWNNISTKFLPITGGTVQGALKSEYDVILGNAQQSPILQITHQKIGINTNAEPLIESLEVKGNVSISNRATLLSSLNISNLTSFVGQANLGTLIKKTEVFNADGSSLGYIPIYNSILFLTDTLVYTFEGSILATVRGDIPSFWLVGSNVADYVDIGSSATSIGSEAFVYNRLTSVTIPNSVTSIGNSAFAYNSLLSAVDCYAAKSAFVGSDIFLNTANPLIIHVRASDSTWTAGPGQSFQGNQNVTVIKDLEYPANTTIYNPNGTLYVTEGNPLNGNVPNNWKNNLGIVGYVYIGSSAASIGNSAFQNNLLTSVTISESLSNISSYAFADNLLTTVTIPNSVTTIESNAFQNNQLGSVTIPNSVTNIGSYAFQNNQLSSVTIPNSVTSIEDNTFAYNSLLSAVDCYAAKSAFVGSDIFLNTANPLIIHVRASDSTWTAGPGQSFQGNQNVTVIRDLPVNTIVYNPQGKILFTVLGDVPEAWMLNQSIAGYVHIGSYATSIGNSAFQNNLLTSVTISESVTSIKDYAFQDNRLASVTIPNSVTNIGARAFQTNQLSSVIIGNSVAAIAIFAFTNNRLTSVTIPNSVTNIGSYAFQTNQLSSVTISESVTSIGNFAFQDNRLTSVTIPNSVTSIEDYAFANNRLTSVTIPNSVTNIGARAFQTNQLSSVTISESVTSIGNFAFQDNRLTSVTIPNSVTIIGSSAFDRNQLTSITISESVTSIEDFTFARNQLSSVTIPESVTIIGSSAFDRNQLTSITIPDSVTFIGNYAFWGNRLTSVTIPNSVTNIGARAFQNNRLGSVIIGNSVAEFGIFAFANNRLTSVTIPNSVTSIGNSAFAYNSLLSAVDCYAAKSAFVGSDIFLNTANPLIIHVRASDSTWTAGPGQSFQGNQNVTVIQDL